MMHMYRGPLLTCPKAGLQYTANQVGERFSTLLRRPFNYFSKGFSGQTLCVLVAGNWRETEPVQTKPFYRGAGEMIGGGGVRESAAGE